MSEYEQIANVKLCRCKQTGKYAVLTDFGVHAESAQGLDSVDKALGAAGDHVRFELRSRDTDTGLAPIDPRALVT